MIETIKSWLGWGEAEQLPMPTAKPNEKGDRSPQWPRVRREHLKGHPTCEVCGTRNDVDVHHLQIYYLHPELELEKTNLFTLCTPHHLLFGHLNNWRSWNPNCVQDAQIWNEKIKNRPRADKA